MAGLEAKRRRILALARRELEPSVRAGMQMFVKEAAGFTPPASKHDGKVTQGIKRLKERIAIDLAGRGETDADMRWVTVNGKPKLVMNGPKSKQMQQPSPFVTVAKADPAAFELLHVGKYGVEYTDDPDGYMRGKPQRYYLKRKGGAAHLRWNGARAVTTKAALKRAVAQRKKRAGTLMSGWNALANAVGAAMPASVKRLPGRGRAERRKAGADRYVMTGRNCADVKGVGLSGILDRKRKNIDHAIRRKLRGRARAIAARMR